MNAGLSNLDTLKKHLLADQMTSETKFDPIISSIGLGMAGLFEQFCNRKFMYVENDQEIFRGNRSHWYSSRFPVLIFTKAELRFFKADNWTDISGQPLSANEQSGLLDFGYTLGVDPIQVRITWTGGYWWPQLEPGDAGYPDQQPANITNSLTVNPTGLPPAAFLLPAVIQLAWLLQCQEVWNKRDKLGVAITDAPDKQVSLASLKLLPIVKDMLQPFKRLMLT